MSKSLNPQVIFLRFKMQICKVLKRDPREKLRLLSIQKTKFSILTCHGENTETRLLHKTAVIWSSTFEQNAGQRLWVRLENGFVCFELYSSNEEATFWPRWAWTINHPEGPGDKSELSGPCWPCSNTPPSDLSQWRGFRPAMFIRHMAKAIWTDHISQTNLLKVHCSPFRSIWIIY